MSADRCYIELHSATNVQKRSDIKSTRIQGNNALAHKYAFSVSVFRCVNEFAFIFNIYHKTQSSNRFAWSWAINRWQWLIPHRILLLSSHSTEMAGSFQYKLGLNELSAKKHRLPNAVLAEFVGKRAMGAAPSTNSNLYKFTLSFIGIFFLNFFACGSCTFGDLNMMSLAFGLAVFVAVMVSVLKPISNTPRFGSSINWRINLSWPGDDVMVIFAIHTEWLPEQWRYYCIYLYM